MGLNIIASVVDAPNVNQALTDPFFTSLEDNNNLRKEE